MAEYGRMAGILESRRDPAAEGTVYYVVQLLRANPNPVLCEEGLTDVLDIVGDLTNLFGDNPQGEASTKQDLGALYLCLGDYEAALHEYDQTLAIMEQTNDLAGQAAVRHNIGIVYERQARHADALQSLEDALELWRQVGDRAGEATTLNGLGSVHEREGRYEETLRCYREGMAIWQTLDDPAQEGRTLYNIGVVYKALGQYDRALISYEDALSKLEGNAEDWTIYGNLGVLYYSLGQYEDALSWYGEMLELTQAFGDRTQEAGTLNNIGMAYYELDRYEEARVQFQAALAIAREMNDRIGEGIILNNLGLAEQARGEYEEAVDQFEAALAIFHEIGDQAGEGKTAGNIGFVHEAQGDSASAVIYYRRAVQAIESTRGRLGVEEFKITFAADYAWIYRRLVVLLHGQGQSAQAFEYTERASARAFLDSLGNRRSDLRQGADAGLLAQEEALHGELAALEGALLKERSEPHEEQDSQAVESTEMQLAAKQREYEDLLAQLQLANPELASLVTIPTTTVTDAQGLLDDQTTLVSYYLTDENGLAFVLTHDDFQVVELLATSEQVVQAVADFRSLGLANLDNPYPRSLGTLYQWLVEPVLPHLTTPKVSIIPHQALHYVPFAALHDGERYFGEQFVLSHLPSASALPFIQAKVGREAAAPLILGDPATDDPDLPRLDHAAQEAKAVSDLLDAEPLLGAEASETALRERVGEAGVVHLAAHGSFNPTAPLFSRLWLAPGGDEDGRLNVHEVYGLDLDRADLVVLSACETQMGELSGGDDVVGLTRAFLYGAPTVVASLWSVDDEATGTLMVRFYTHLREGMGKAEALQAAQADVRDDAEHPEWAHPYYWAGFVLSGDPGAVGDTTLAATPTASASEESGEGGSCFGAVMPLAAVLVSLVRIRVGRANRLGGAR